MSTTPELVFHLASIAPLSVEDWNLGRVKQGLHRSTTEQVTQNSQQIAAAQRIIMEQIIEIKKI